MLCSLAREYWWETDIYFVPPNNRDDFQIELFIKQYRPDLISFSFKSFERNQALSLAKTIRRITHTKIIAGGIHPSLMPYDMVQTNLFDAIIVGDGMGIWEDILERYIDLNGEIIYGKAHPNKDFYTKYFYSKSQIERMKSTEMATVLTSIGCPYKCSFCHSGSQRFFPYPIENIARHVLELYNQYGVRNFHFLDDLFAGNIKRLQEFQKIIEKSGSDIAFSSQVSGKADIFNEDIAQELIKLGVETVNFGIETASSRLLKFLNKKQTIEDCYKAIHVCHKLGLNCVINLMFGIPTQDDNDYKCTLEFVKSAKPDSVNCFFYSPYPGTKLYDYCFDHQYLPKSFDRNRFDWFGPSIDGTSSIQIKLNNVDYELATQYIKEIHQIMDRDEDLLEKMRVIDSYPWVLVGTTRHYYYITLIKKLSYFHWKNFCGYINIDKEAGFCLEKNIDTSFYQYDEKINKIPSLCITYSFLGADFRVIERYVQKLFGKDIPLISISSFQRGHSISDIKRLIKDRILISDIMTNRSHNND